MGRGRGRLQRHGDGVTRSQPRGSLQLLLPQVQPENCAPPSRPTGWFLITRFTRNSPSTRSACECRSPRVCDNKGFTTARGVFYGRPMLFPRMRVCKAPCLYIRSHAYTGSRLYNNSTTSVISYSLCFSVNTVLTCS